MRVSAKNSWQSIFAEIFHFWAKWRTDRQSMVLKLTSSGVKQGSISYINHTYIPPFYQFTQQIQKWWVNFFWAICRSGPWSPAALTIVAVQRCGGNQCSLRKASIKHWTSAERLPPHYTQNCTANQFYIVKLQIAFTTLTILLCKGCQSDNSFTWHALLNEKKHCQLKTFFQKKKKKKNGGGINWEGRAAQKEKAQRQNLDGTEWVLHFKKKKSSFEPVCNQILSERSVTRWNQIKRRPYIKTQPFSRALWKHAANCVWQIESILQCPLPGLCKISFPASFSCLAIVDTQVSHFLHALQTQRETSDIYWAQDYLYSISSFTTCRLLWAHSGEILKKLIVY